MNDSEAFKKELECAGFPLEFDEFIYPCNMVKLVAPKHQAKKKRKRLCIRKEGLSGGTSKIFFYRERAKELPPRFRSAHLTAVMFGENKDTPVDGKHLSTM